MSNKCSIALSLFAGILGGALTRYIAPASVLAQNNQSTASKEIRAQSVTLVDEMNQTVGTFTVAPDPGWRPAINGGGWGSSRRVLRDSRGREIWSAGGSLFHQLTER
jgi:hypothetical protein